MSWNILVSTFLFALIGILTIALVAYSFYLRIRQSTYTDKRFHFVAFSACIAIYSTAISLTVGPGKLFPILKEFGFDFDLSLSEKMLIIIAAIAFTALISHWARSWTGLVTSTTPPSQRPFFFFASDGASEYLRLIRRLPPYSAHKLGTSTRATPYPSLPTPITNLQFNAQIRELCLARWPEYEIKGDSWVADAHCWIGRDRSLNQPLILVAAHSPDEISISRLSQQMQHLDANREPALMVVIEKAQRADPVFSALGNSFPRARCFLVDDFISATIPLHRYIDGVKSLFDEHKIASSSLALRDTYVGTQVLNLQLSAKSSSSKEARRTVDIRGFIGSWLHEVSGRQIALLGDYGQGKSSEAIALTYSILIKGIRYSATPRVPILIRLTGMSPKSMTPEELLGAWGAAHGLNGKSLLALHQAGRTILIFDAFDEMSSVADRTDRYDHFSTLWKFACPGAKIIFTGRPNFFLDDEELKLTLGIAEGLAAGPYCSAIKIAPFNKGQIAQSLRWLRKDKSRSLIKAMDQSPRLAELARRPSLLFQIAQLWEHNRIKLNEGEINSARVIRDFVTYSFERQVEKQRISVAESSVDKNFILLRMAELDLLTIACAVKCLTEGRNNSLSAAQLEQTIRACLPMLQAVDLPRRPSETGSLALPLAQRLADKANPVEACAHAVRTHGVLEHDPTKSAHYKFSHKSFAEVLAAEEIVRHSMEETPSHVIEISDTDFRSLLQQDAVFAFAIELIDRRDIRPYSGLATIGLFYPRSLRFVARFNYLAALFFANAIQATIYVFERLPLLARMREKGRTLNQIQSRILVESKEELQRVVKRMTYIITAIAFFFALTSTARWPSLPLSKPAGDISEFGKYLNVFALFGAAAAFGFQLALGRSLKRGIGLFSEPTLYCYALDRLRSSSDRLLRSTNLLDRLLKRKLERAYFSDFRDHPRTL